MDQQDNQSNQPVLDNQNDINTQPGSLSFIPEKPELGGAVESISPVQETAPIQVEKTPVPERIKTIEDVKPEQQSDATPPTATNTTAKPAAPKVVDKSRDPLNLHHIQNPKDKLTAEADEEEEKFIKEVEAAHEQP